MNAVALAVALSLAAAPDAPVPPVPPAPPAPAVAPVPPVPPAPPAEAVPGAEPERVLLGQWPAQSPKVTVDFERVRTREAIKKLAELGRFSVTFKDKPSGRVDATFNDVPADQALASVLKDSGLVARRDGDVVSIAHASEEDDDSDAAPRGGARGAVRASDRVQVGGSVKIAEGETVRDAVAVGGSVEVNGTVLHDAVAVGGSVRLGPNAVVKHDVVSVGGSLDIDPGARVEGERVNVGMGGISIFDRGSHPGAKDKDKDEGLSVKVFDHEESWFLRATKGLARFAVLFVLGLLLLAFVPERVKALGKEIRRAPAVCGGIGLVGMVGLVPLTLLLVVTVVGILVVPFLYLAVGVALLLGFTALALELGGTVPPRSARRTQVAVLGLGVLGMYLVSLVPVVGPLALFFASLVVFGAALRTKLGNNRIDANFVPQP